MHLPPVPTSPPLPVWAMEAASLRHGYYPGHRPFAVFAQLPAACGEGHEHYCLRIGDHK